MNYLRELMKDYKNEVKEILAADKTLAMEIQVCGVLVSNPLTHLKDRCVSIVVFEASKLDVADLYLADVHGHSLKMLT